MMLPVLVLEMEVSLFFSSFFLIQPSGDAFSRYSSSSLSHPREGTTYIHSRYSGGCASEAKETEKDRT